MNIFDIEDINLEENMTCDIFEDKAVKTDSSFFANWEVVSTIPKSYNEEVSFEEVPYKSRVND